MGHHGSVTRSPEQISGRACGRQFGKQSSSCGISGKRKFKVQHDHLPSVRSAFPDYRVPGKSAAIHKRDAVSARIVELLQKYVESTLDDSPSTLDSIVTPATSPSFPPQHRSHGQYRAKAAFAPDPLLVVDGPLDRDGNSFRLFEDSPCGVIRVPNASPGVSLNEAHRDEANICSIGVRSPQKQLHSSGEEGGRGDSSARNGSCRNPSTPAGRADRDKREELSSADSEDSDTAETRARLSSVVVCFEATSV